MKYLFSNLKTCRTIITHAKNNKDANAELLGLKMALIETCGWIEERLDQLYFNIIKNDINRLKKTSKIIKLSSFKYSAFCQAFNLCLGKKQFKLLENYYQQNKTFILFQSALNSLQNERNSCAHTYIKGSSTKLIDFKSLLVYLKQVNKGITLVRKYLKNNNFI